jgi:TRAP-type C4-dicarboxylate transport system substrate-binding protein
VRARLVVILAVLAGGSSPVAAEQVEWTMASVAPDGSPSAILLAELARNIERAAGGKLRVRTRFGGVLGNEITTFEDCRRGRVQVWAGSVSAAEVAVPGVTVLDTPYVVEDLAAYQRAVKPTVFDGPLTSRAFRQAGLVPLTAGFVGWRAVSTRDRPVRLPSDLKGMRMRSLPSPLHGAMWRALGAEPKVTGLTEVLSAFRLKLVDAVDLQVVYLFATSLTDQIRFHTRTGHMAQTAAVVVNRDAFLKLPKKAQAELLARRSSWTARSNKVHGDLEIELVDALRAQGVTIIELSAAERAAWKAATASMAAEALRLGGKVGAEILGAMRAP